MKHIVTALPFCIFLLMFSACKEDMILNSCADSIYTYNCDLKIYVVDSQGVNLISSGDYDPTLFRWQARHGDGRYHLAAYSFLQNPYLYTVENDGDGERGEYILSPLDDRLNYDPTERRVDERNPDIEYWTTDIVLSYNYFDGSERTDTLRSVIRYEHYSECPTDVQYLQELHINGSSVWQEGITAGAPEWTVVR
jgi:hypothetical protein